MGYEVAAALGVKQSGVVLRYVIAARDAGLGVVFITHNPHHTHMVGDHFAILKPGKVEVDQPRARLSPEALAHRMAGGSELDTLQQEPDRGAAIIPGAGGG